MPSPAPEEHVTERTRCTLRATGMHASGIHVPEAATRHHCTNLLHPRVDHRPLGGQDASPWDPPSPSNEVPDARGMEGAWPHRVFSSTSTTSRG
jgi:hypothetical protein